jgi:glutamate mutase epsilon subunit
MGKRRMLTFHQMLAEFMPGAGFTKQERSLLYRQWRVRFPHDAHVHSMMMNRVNARRFLRKYVVKATRKQLFETQAQVGIQRKFLDKMRADIDQDLAASYSRMRRIQEAAEALKASRSSSSSSADEESDAPCPPVTDADFIF